jgi:hypothetical protein
MKNIIHISKDGRLLGAVGCGIAREYRRYSMEE